MQEDIAELEELLVTLREYFIQRDEMNAKIHLSDVRYSPLTEKVAFAADMLIFNIKESLNDNQGK